MTPLLILTVYPTDTASTFTIPINGVSNITVDWGDGNTDGLLSHEFTTSGSNLTVTVYAISSGGTVSLGGGSGWTTPEFLIEVVSWYNGITAITEFGYAFAGCNNLVSVPNALPPGTTSLFSMFFSATSINHPNIINWDISGVLTLSYTFYNARAFKQNIGGWNTHSVSSMNSMFSSAVAFNQDISQWDTSNVTDMAGMFSNATVFNQPINYNLYSTGTWNTSKVMDMSSMFNNATSFNQSISDWNTGSVTNMYLMFSNAVAFNQPITGWDTSNVQNMSYMFANASAFDSDLSFNTVSVNDMSFMFNNASQFNQNIGNWDTSKVGVGFGSMAYMFSGASKFNQDLSWNTSNVTDMTCMFYNDASFNGDITGWNTGKVINMISMFSNAISFDQMIGQWDTSSVQNMAGMFSNAAVFNQDLSWNTVSVTSMNSMFSGAIGFTGLLGNGISRWNTSSVTDMSSMFNSATHFNQDISAWDTSKVTNMSQMFSNTVDFNQNIGNWDTHSVVDMSYMFSNSVNFNQDLSWNTVGLINATQMFGGTHAFTGTLGSGSISRWNTINVQNMGNMFVAATVFSQDISGWIVGNVLPTGGLSGFLNGANSFSPQNNPTNLNNLLNSWAVQSVKPGLTLDANSSYYDNRGLSGYNTLTNAPDNWTINANRTYLFLVLTVNVITNPTVFQIPLTYQNGNFMVTNVDWGDGDAGSSNLTHTYTTIGSYTINVYVSGSTTNISLGNDAAGNTRGNQLYWGDSTILTTVQQWTDGTNYVQNFAYAFQDCSNLTSVPTDISSCVLDMTAMFAGTSSFNQSTISNWDTSSVQYMIVMFYNSSFNQPIGGWNVGNVLSMIGMFASDTFNPFNQNISTWNTSNVTIMVAMFFNAANFNQDISSWDIRNVVNFSSFLTGATSFSPQNNPTNLNNLFNTWSTLPVQQNVPFDAPDSWYDNNGLGGFTSLTAGGSWTITANFISSTPPLLVLTVNPTDTTSTFTVPLYGVSVSSVDWGDGTVDTSLTHVFTSTGTKTVSVSATSSGGTVSLSNGSWDIPEFLIGVVSWDDGVTAITDFTRAFYGCSNLVSVPTTLPAGVLNVSYMFSGATAFNQDISGWNTSTVQNMSSMFSGATAFNQNIGSWTTSSVQNMSSMFSGATAFNQNIGSWTTSAVQSMSGMFANASFFDGDLSGWYTNNVQDMSYMFYNATHFTGKGLANWNTYFVINMTDMFYNASAFNANISSWRFRNVNSFFGTYGFLTGATSFSPQNNPANLNSLLNSLYTQAQSPGLNYGLRFDAPDSYYNTASLNSYNWLTNHSNTNWTINAMYLPPPPYHYPCFLEGTNILCSVNGKEVEMPIEEIRRGTLVKTLRNGYMPVEIIGKKVLYNPGNSERIKDRLYHCSPNQYPDLKEDLYITGCHSILVDTITEEERELTKKLIDRIFVTDKKYRLMACVDKRAEPYTKEGDYTIWHLALEHADYYMNYGIFANGLLVESSSRRYMKECSQMELLM